MFATIMEAAAIASSLSIDAFVAGLAYGSNKTKISFMSIQIINIICSGITSISLLAGAALSPYIPQEITAIIAFSILFVVGIMKLLDGATKSLIRKYSGVKKKLTGSFLNLEFVLHLYANPEEADINASKDISTGEAALLALSLSLDGMAVGFGASLAGINWVAVAGWSLITNAVFLALGHLAGRKAARANVSWLGGIVLIGLAISKLF